MSLYELYFYITLPFVAIIVGVGLQALLPLGVLTSQWMNRKTVRPETLNTDWVPTRAQLEQEIRDFTLPDVFGRDG